MARALRPFDCVYTLKPFSPALNNINANFQPLTLRKIFFFPQQSLFHLYNSHLAEGAQGPYLSDVLAPFQRLPLDEIISRIAHSVSLSWRIGSEKFRERPYSKKASHFQTTGLMPFSRLKKAKFSGWDVTPRFLARLS
ncbi:hypothetical protein LSTR_LSTR005135 [Laodelphax striatellus]|uniref:Uncharacterized protein n=1 Tax=Laodelphax striatellus TaxID=195883 RepID=A0A482WPV2_LAOST|nr:hypothetical protein LSTR_LSTR005135 [Laodelphax striatellus]